MAALMAFVALLVLFGVIAFFSAVIVLIGTSVFTTRRRRAANQTAICLDEYYAADSPNESPVDMF